MQAARKVEPGRERFGQRWQPALGNGAAGVGETDDQRPGARSARIGDRHDRQLKAGPAAVKADLADAHLRTPVLDADSRLGCELIAGIADKEHIGGL